MSSIGSITLDQIRKAVDDPAKTALVCMGSRPGVTAFITGFEFRFFHPAKEGAVEAWDMFIVHWGELPWLILSYKTVDVPKEKLDELLQQTGLKVADGVPAEITPSGMDYFPINLPNVFHVENSQEFHADQGRFNQEWEKDFTEKERLRLPPYPIAVIE